jgi:glycosyltransferase involved in cell wall biosynthesis
VAAPTAAIVSFRLGGTDGVAIEAEKWRWALAQRGFRIVTVAGEGPVDHLLPGLAIGADEPPRRSELEDSVSDADLVVVENLCSLPLNPAASDLVAGVLRGRPAVMRHHDLPWQREATSAMPPPPDDPAWVHVTVNDLSRHELAERRITATLIYNRFDTAPAPGDRERTRLRLGLDPSQVLVLQPTRAIPRKNVPGGLHLAEGLDAAYWLLGPAEDGYGPELDQVLESARTRVIRGSPDATTVSASDAYAASDVVVMPSFWEGFGNPAIESAVYRRPLAVGSYPVARELEAFGFGWFGIDSPDLLTRWLEFPDSRLLERNYGVADKHFALRDLPGELGRLFGAAGWTW